jgi:hypothetical protein
MSMRSVQAMDMGYSPRPLTAPPGATVGTGPHPAGSGVSAQAMPSMQPGNNAPTWAWVITFLALALLRVWGETARGERAE